MWVERSFLTICFVIEWVSRKIIKNDKLLIDIDFRVGVCDFPECVSAVSPFAIFRAFF